jgi:hypothetical protein
MRVCGQDRPLLSSTSVLVVRMISVLQIPAVHTISSKAFRRILQMRCLFSQGSGWSSQQLITLTDLFGDTAPHPESVGMSAGVCITLCYDIDWIHIPTSRLHVVPLPEVNGKLARRYRAVACHRLRIPPKWISSRVEPNLIGRFTSRCACTK